MAEIHHSRKLKIWSCFPFWRTRWKGQKHQKSSCTRLWKTRSMGYCGFTIVSCVLDRVLAHTL